MDPKPLYYNLSNEKYYYVDAAGVSQELDLAAPAELTASLASTSAITMTSGVVANITSLTFPTDTVVRDYLVQGDVQQTFTTSPTSATPTSFTLYFAGISTTSATAPTVPDVSRNGWTGAAQIVTSPTYPLLGSGFITGAKRITVPANTSVTVYLIYEIIFTGTAPTAYGVIKAQPLFF